MNKESSQQSNKNTLSHALDLTQACAKELDYAQLSDSEDETISYWEEYPTDINDYMTLMNKVAQVKRAINLIEKDMKNRLAHDFKDKAIKVGDKVIVGKPSKSWKPYDKEKVMDFVGDDWRLVINPTFRTTGIKALAEQRGLDPNVIFESLFYQEEKDDVSILPSSKAPKYLQQLNDGDVKELGK